MDTDGEDCVAPKGVLKIVGSHQRNGEHSSLGVWANIVVEDEVGNKFTFPTSCFEFDMKPLPKTCSVEDCTNEPTRAETDGYYCEQCYTGK